MFTIDFPGRIGATPSLASAGPCFENLTVARDMLLDLIPKAQDLKVAAFHAHRADASGADTAASLDTLLHEQHIAQAELASWSKAFRRLRASNQGPEASSLAELLLYVKYVSTKIYIDTALAFSQDVYAEYIDDFKSIIAAAEEGMRYASDDERSFGFTFEGGFLASLYLAGLKCRDLDTRRNLLELMHHTHAKEGLWCRSEAICVVKRVMDIEEGRSSLAPQLRGGKEPSPTPPRFYEVSCEINYRKLGSLFVDVTYLLYDEASPEPWQTFNETLLIEGQ